MFGCDWLFEINVQLFASKCSAGTSSLYQTNHSGQSLGFYEYTHHWLHLNNTANPAGIAIIGGPVRESLHLTGGNGKDTSALPTALLFLELYIWDRHFVLGNVDACTQLFVQHYRLQLSACM